MQVAEGYKLTEVGVIPEDWKVQTASTLCVKIQDGTHFSPIMGGNDYLYITSKNIRSGYLKLDTAERISAQEHKKIYTRCDVAHGDLLLTKDGANTGNATLNTLTEEFSLLSSVAFLRFHKKSHSASFYMQQILSSQGQQQIQEAMAGNAITRLTLEKINKLKFAAPPTKAEQEAIAEALSDADSLIESLQQLIAKKRQIKQGAMQNLLHPKPDWVEKTLGDVLKVRHGRSQHEVISANGTYPILATGGQIGKSTRYLYNRPSVLIGRKGTIDRPQYMSTPFWTVDTLFYSEILNSNDAKYLYYQFCLIDWKGHNESSGVPSLNASTIESIEISIPAPAEQIRIATILSDMDEEVTTLETKLTKAQQIKQGMMSELLTGKTRLV